ncbi:UNVERIFIED_CONTAM: hypothetical protein Sindi_1834200 [Sesamum indicum]
MSGEKWVPDWKISKNRSVLRTLAGQDSWEIYKAACLERDQIIVAQASHTSIEEHLAHNIAQRHEKIAANSRTLDHDKKILEQQTLIESLQSEVRSMAELTLELETTKRTLEELRSAAHNDRKAAFESGREQGLHEGQIQKLGGLNPDFDLEQLDVGLDRNMEPYPSEPPPSDEFPEFAPLMDELPSPKLV